MAVTADKVVVELELKDGAYLAKVRASESAFVKAQQRTAKSAEDAERRIRASSQGIANSLKAVAGTLAAGVSVAAVTKMADAYTSMQNRLRVTGVEGAKLEDQFDKLNRVADDSRSPIEGIVGVYSRLRIATEGLGFTNSDVTRTTEILTKALRASGATALETSSALLQFGQGIGSGALQGDELRSIRENAPLVAKAIADEFNVTVGGLKKLGEEGKLTSERVVKAVLASGQAIDAAWEKTDATVGDALTNLQNRMIRYIGESDASAGATKRFVQAVGLLADNIDKIVPAIVTLTAVVGAKYVAAGVASVASSVAQAIAHERAGGAAIGQALALDGLVASQGRALTVGEIAAAKVGLQAGQMGRATIGAKALGNALLAFAGGPLGATVLAVGALVAGIIYLNNKFSEGAVTSRKLEAQSEATASAFGEYEKAAEAAAKATGKAKEAADALVESKKAAYYYALQHAQALAEETAQMAAQRAEMAKLAAQEATNGRPKEIGEALGQAAFAGGAQREADRAQAQAEQAAKDYGKTLQDLIDLQERIRNGFATPASADPEGKKKKGKTAEQLAREAEQRARLLVDIERGAQIEEASLAQNVARVRELERQAEIEARIRQLKDAGFSAEAAQAVSSKVQTRLDEARAQDMQRRLDLQERGYTLTIAELNENFELARQIERRTEYEERLAAYKEVSRDAAEAQRLAEADMLGIDEARLNAANRYLKAQSSAHALRIAELTGNRQLADSLRDQEAILQRTNELRAQGRLSLDAARTQATNEVTAERSATKYGEQRDFFASTFSEGIRAAMAGDLQGFLSSQFGNIADMALTKLGESIFDSFSNAPAAIATAQAEGAAQGVAFSATVSTAMTTSGGLVASAIGSAILTSGTTVAALMAKAQAASKVASAFGGGRAGGGSVRAGFSYDVGENGREKFVAPSNGYIIPNMKNANASPGMSGVVRIQIGEGEMFSARVTEIAGPLSVQTAMTGVAYSQDQMTVANKRRGQSFV